MDSAPTRGVNIIMGYNSKIHHRKSIRLNGYDYSQAGLYFVTICCQNRVCLFGEIINGKMVLNDAGRMIEKIWHEIPNDFPNIYLNEYITMPNHIHGIIETAAVGADSISAHSISAPISAPKRAEMDSAPTPTGTPTEPGTGLSRVVQSFKRHTTIEYIKMVKQNILPVFDKRIWQRNYWEHIIRNKNECIRISEYITNNPINWNTDKLNGGEGNFIMESSTPYNEENWMV